MVGTTRGNCNYDKGKHRLILQQQKTTYSLTRWDFAKLQSTNLSVLLFRLVSVNNCIYVYIYINGYQNAKQTGNVAVHSYDY